jgi:hypothetical protein
MREGLPVISMAFRFTPADGSPPFDITATLKNQDKDGWPFLMTIEWPDWTEEHNWPSPPLWGLENAGRFIADRLLDRAEAWGGGTYSPDVERPRPYAP